jgi:hypothetical protein
MKTNTREKNAGLLSWQDVLIILITWAVILGAFRVIGWVIGTNIYPTSVIPLLVGLVSGFLTVLWLRRLRRR